MGPLVATTPATSLIGCLRFIHATTRFSVSCCSNSAADAIELAGASRDTPIEFEGIRERYLPEAVAHTRAQHHKSKFALRAAAMLRGGVDRGLLDEVIWRRTDDLWFWLKAFVVYVRVAADRTGEPIETVCRRLAERRLVELDYDAT